MIEFRKVSFQYNETEGNGINNINLHIKKGEFVLLSGPSGCGKTTLTRCINGLIPHFYEGNLNGCVVLNGKDISKMKLNEISMDVGSVFQDPRSQFFTTDTVSEVAFGCENNAIPRNEMKERVDHAIKELKIEQLKEKSLFELSSGERQRIAIASVHALAPEIYVLDEPSANLDAQSAEDLRKTLILLKQKGATIIISEHRLYYLKDLVDRVIYMQRGECKKEYNRNQFLSLTEAELNEMGLRCLYPEKLAIQKVYEQQTKEALLKVDQVDYRYKKRIPLLRNIEFQAFGGEVIGIIGHNGAGKSTLAELLCGLKKEQNGSICVDSQQMKPKERVRSSYFIMQDSEYQLFSESVEEELTLGLRGGDGLSQKVEEVLKILNLKEYRERHPASLSGGQKQRVVIAAAYMRDLKFVIFDEPTSGLDAENMKRVGKLIKKMAGNNRSAFIITHDYELLLDTCQRVLYMQKGKIKEDFMITPETLPRVKEIFGMNKEMI